MSEHVLERVAEGLVVRPGDTLILRLDAEVSPEELVRARDLVLGVLTERAPGVDVLILGGRVEQMAVARPEGGSDG